MISATLSTPLAPSAYADIEALGAAAYAQGRACLPLLRSVVVPALPPLQRYTPERVIALIETRNLLDGRSVTDIEILLDMVARLVAQGTVETLRSSGEFEAQVTEPRTWIERRRTPETQRLAEAAEALERLRDLAVAVLDLQHAQHAIMRLQHRG